MARVWSGGLDTEYLTIPTSTVWNFNTNICALAIVNPSDVTGEEHTLVGVGVVNNTGWMLRVGGAGSPNFNKSGITAPGSTLAIPAINEWYALMVTSSTGANTLFKLYRYSTSGLTTDTAAETGTMVSPSNTGGVLGQRLAPLVGESWIGTIDRVLIGQGTVSDAEFTAWARAGTLPPSLTVKGYWILSPSGTATSPELDTSGNALHLTTISGTTASAAFTLPDATPVYSQVAYRWRANDGSLIAP